MADEHSHLAKGTFSKHLLSVSVVLRDIFLDADIIGGGFCEVLQRLVSLGSRLEENGPLKNRRDLQLEGVKDALGRSWTTAWVLVPESLRAFGQVHVAQGVKKDPFLEGRGSEAEQVPAHQHQIHSL